MGKLSEMKDLHPSLSNPTLSSSINSSLSASHLVSMVPIHPLISLCFQPLLSSLSTPLTSIFRISFESDFRTTPWTFNVESKDLYAKVILSLNSFLSSVEFLSLVSVFPASVASH